MKELIIFKIKSTEDYKKNSMLESGNEIERQPSKVSNEVITIELFKRYDITAYCKEGIQKLFNLFR